MKTILGYERTENIEHNRRPTAKTGDLIPSVKLDLGIVAEHWDLAQLLHERRIGRHVAYCLDYC